MVVLLVIGNNNIVTSNSLDQKVKKLYAARSKREAELHAIHEDILHCTNSQSRRVKVTFSATFLVRLQLNTKDNTFLQVATPTGAAPTEHKGQHFFTSRRVKVERLSTKCNEAFMTVVDTDEDLIAFVGKTEDPSALVPSLESYLEAMTTKNDKILTSARNCINSADDKVNDFQEPRASLRSRLPSIMASSQKHLVSVNMIT